MRFRPLYILLTGYLILAACFCAWVYSDALETALADDRNAGLVRLSEAVSRLKGQLDVYRALVNIAADDPKIQRTLSLQHAEDIHDHLAQFSLTYGATRIDLIRHDGTLIATSDDDRLPMDYDRSLIWSATHGQLGYHIIRNDRLRHIQFSRGVSSFDGQSLGALIVSIELEALEFEWPIIPEPIIFFDGNGLSISANRPELLFPMITNNPTASDFPLSRSVKAYGATLWTYAPPGQTITEVQALNMTIPQLKMDGKILLDTKPARALATLRLGLAATVMLAGMLIGAILIQQRRKIALEARHSATLEQRVEERTEALQTAQKELVEASNLAALGRLAAGMSHELNQPLGAVLNYAENGKRLIEKARTEEASSNLGRIAEQVHRINRIISNLRAFARQEYTPTERIDLIEVIERALEIIGSELKSCSIFVETSLPQNPVFVMAGKIRLEQVLLNLISNARDAMLECERRHLTISLEAIDEKASLTIKDTGTGIQNPDRIFEPFYSTKQLGSSKGLGMGLALSHGIIARFGGKLRGRNHKEGAEFTLILPMLLDADDERMKDGHQSPHH